MLIVSVQGITVSLWFQHISTQHYELTQNITLNWRRLALSTATNGDVSISNWNLLKMHTILLERRKKFEFIFISFFSICFSYSIFIYYLLHIFFCGFYYFHCTLRNTRASFQSFYRKQSLSTYIQRVSILNIWFQPFYCVKLWAQFLSRLLN